MIGVERLRVALGGQVVLDDCTLEVGDHELLTLVGPSGCGKTTLLRTMAGLQEPASGTVHIGHDVTAVPPAARNVAMVFQGYALYPHLDVHENIAFGLRARKTPAADIGPRVADAARALRIEPLLRRKPATLSGGERQRVALARAFVRRPKLFLLDEPLANLDAPLRHEARLLIAGLHREADAAMLHVTHDQAEALSLGERVAVMRDGRIEQVATPAVLYEEPANTFVASFIGAPAMNLINGWPGEEGVVTGVRPEALLVTADGVPATVVGIEHLGDHAIVTFETLAQRMCARVTPDRIPAIGDEVRLSCARPTRFDAATGERLA